MKKLIAAFAFLASSVLLIILIFACTVSAQARIFSSDVSAGKTPASAEKIFVNEISTRAMRNFKNEFRNVDDEDWRIEKDGFVAYFKAEESAFWVYYNLRGNWEHALIAYPENKMPRLIRAQIKSTYYDYQIDVVKEIRSLGDIIYVVQMEDKKGYKSVLVNKDGEMELIASLDKQ